MKTIHRRNKSDQSQQEIKKLLVDDPHSHPLLTKQSSDHSDTYIDDLIDLKKKRQKTRKSAGKLIASISLCLSFLIVIGAFEWNFREAGSEISLESNDRSFEDLIDVPQTEQIQKPPVQVQVPKIIEVADEEVIEEIEINLDIEMTEDTKIEEVIFQTEDTDELMEEKADEIFVFVEEQPSPKGGLKEFYSYVSANLIYPAQARRMGIEGRVFVEFIVEKDGSLTNIQVAKGIGAGCNEEAIRVISEAPPWNPGKQRGNAVRVRMLMPIVFKLFTGGNINH